ncbi:hypothetical protein ACFLXG_04010 [Chloroflexota bacterium]
MKLDDVSKYMEKAGIPGRDDYNLTSSNKRFPDGASYRIEMSGIEGPKVLEALIKERKKRNVPVHRLISFNMGGTLYDMQELRDFARMAAEDKMEVIAIPGPRNAWDIGRQFLTEEGSGCAPFNHRGSDELRKVIADIMRMYDAGMRGFLVYDPGLMWLINTMREQGNFPKDAVVKISVGAGISSPAGARLMEILGATSFNPIADLPLPQLASIRKAVDTPIDFYIWPFDTFGGSNRFYDAPEVARLYSPCYFKFEPAPTAGKFYAPWTADAAHIDLTVKKIKWAQTVIEMVSENQPGIKVSEQGPADLYIPKI